MKFAREIQRLLMGLLVAFFAISVLAAYWSIVRSGSLLSRDDNPRTFEEIASIVRGDIVDRIGRILATTIVNEDGFLNERIYAYPSMNGATGYYSLRYGEGGPEAAYNDALSGAGSNDTFWTLFEQDILHYAQTGNDIQLTYDAVLQDQIVNQMKGHNGAAVVMGVPGGDILALVSLPTYDPNTLDQEWETLVSEAGNPFFNRAIQGGYQPGGAMMPILITSAVLRPLSLDTVFENATDPILARNAQLNCLEPPPDSSLSLTDAFLYGCPAPFAQLVYDLGPEHVDETFALFGMFETETLDSFATDIVAEENDSAEPQSASSISEASTATFDNALGQGDIVISPIKMASITAAFVNDGNSPNPFTLRATRPVGSMEWEPVIQSNPARPITTAETAREVRDLMLEAVTSGVARGASQDEIVVGGYAALAYSGDETIAWFAGFTMGPDQETYVAVIALESVSDPQKAAQIGGEALAAAVALPQTTETVQAQ